MFGNKLARITTFRWRIKTVRLDSRVDAAEPWSGTKPRNLSQGRGRRSNASLRVTRGRQIFVFRSSHRGKHRGYDAKLTVRTANALFDFVHLMGLLGTANGRGRTLNGPA